MRRALFSSVTMLGALAVLGCESAAPSIEITQVVSTELRVDDDRLDDLVLHVRYEDPDGDLGGGQIVVHDCRDAAFVSRFSVDPIATDGAVEAGVAIRGEIVVTVADVEAIAPAAERPAVCTAAGAPRDAFCVVIEDAAGHASNGACTGAITYATPEV